MSVVNAMMDYVAAGLAPEYERIYRGPSVSFWDHDLPALRLYDGDEVGDSAIGLAPGVWRRHLMVHVDLALSGRDSRQRVNTFAQPMEAWFSQNPSLGQLAEQTVMYRKIHSLEAHAEQGSKHIALVNYLFKVTFCSDYTVTAEPSSVAHIDIDAAVEGP